MRVLGLNGWGQHSHDAAACVLVDGRVIAFAEEERFTRRKHAWDSPPHHAVAFCLNASGLSLDEIDCVAFGWDAEVMLSGGGWRPPAATPQEALEHLCPSAWFPRRRDPAIEFVPHHTAHAASAYYFSGDEDAAVLVVDGQGENSSATVLTGKQGQLTTLQSIPVGWSLGYFYEAACLYAGLRNSDPGKLMGLAGYGTAQDFLEGEIILHGQGFEMPHMPVVVDGPVDVQAAAVFDQWLRRFTALAPLARNGATGNAAAAHTFPRPQTDVFEYRHFAATVQHALEGAMAALARLALGATTSTTLHIAGGVGLNATANGRLAAMPEVGRLFVQPVAGDAGVAMGAAAWVASQAGDTIDAMTGSTAWGPEYSADDIRATLDESGLHYSEPCDLAADVALLLSNDNIVGWFQGRAEGGPRALGQRSILANPSQRANREVINRTIKERELWRPLAPSIAAEASREVFGRDVEMPYMIQTVPVREAVHDRLAAVLHEDGTTRPQTVSASRQPLYHDLLRAASKQWGLAAVLNTSFNGRDEPVVLTPADAVATLTRSHLDALAIGPYLVCVEPR